MRSETVGTPFSSTRPPRSGAPPSGFIQFIPVLCGSTRTISLRRRLHSIRIEEFAVEPIVPLNDLDFGQSARGLNVHYIVYGLAFDRMPIRKKRARYLLLHAAMHATPRMQLSGLFPTGRLSADGLPPPGVRQNSHPPQVPRHATAVEGHGGILTGTPPWPSGAQQKKEQQDQAEAAARPAAHGFCIRCVEHGFEAVGSDEI